MEEETNSDPVSWISASKTCSRTFTNGLCLMRHWNNDHKNDNLPRDCKFPENVISPCFICETLYAEGENHRCQTRKNHKKCLRNQNSLRSLTKTL